MYSLSWMPACLSRSGVTYICRVLLIPTVWLSFFKFSLTLETPYVRWHLFDFLFALSKRIRYGFPHGRQTLISTNKDCHTHIFQLLHSLFPGFTTPATDMNPQECGTARSNPPSVAKMKHSSRVIPIRHTIIPTQEIDIRSKDLFRAHGYLGTRTIVVGRDENQEWNPSRRRLRDVSLLTLYHPWHSFVLQTQYQSLQIRPSNLVPYRPCSSL